MLIVRYSTQPLDGAPYVSLIKQALEVSEFTRLDTAMAYATSSGVDVLSSLPTTWHSVRKRWLIGIDWCRSEPLALEKLASMKRSKVRVHDGAAVVSRKNCPPFLPFHPKTFIARQKDAIAVVSGSGNLSANGLTRGHETGTLVLLQKPLKHHEKAIWTSCLGVAKWFDKLWTPASDLASVESVYRRRFEDSEHLGSPVPTEDDAAPTLPKRGMSPAQLKQLRACRHLWIQAGNLHKNRGQGRPGNQLMLSPMTRVYFGFRATNVSTDTLIGHVALEYGAYLRPDCSLRFSNNSMDVLTLPVPGAGGPPSYDQEALLFERVADPAGSRFVLRLGTKAQKKSWYKASDAISASFKMSSGRQWGVF